MRITRFLFCLGVSIFSLSPAYGAKLIYGKARVVVPILAREVTILKFPKAVKMVPRPGRFSFSVADESQADYTLLKVEPLLTEGESKVTFILEDGEVIRTTFLVVKDNTITRTDDFYEFSAGTATSEQTKEAPRNVSDLDLLKAMKLDYRVDGYQVVRVNKWVRKRKDGLNVMLIKEYRGSKYNGYVYEVFNESKKKSFSFDLRQLRLGEPNLAVIAQIDSFEIKPKSKETQKVMLRIVSEASNQVSKMRLPIGEISKEAGE